MTNVIVNAIDVLGQEIDEGVVKISAADIQKTGGTLMLPEYHEQALVAGSTTILGVTPGKVVISIHWGINRTATFRVHIPDTDEITLADLTLQKYDTDPAIVSQVTDAARRAEDARDTAVEAAGTVAVAETTINQTRDAAVQAVVDTRDSSVTSVESARDTAVSTVNSRIAVAEGHANAAAASASEAATSEGNAADSASTSDDAAATAVAALVAAEQEAQEAAAAADSITALTTWTADAVGGRNLALRRNLADNSTHQVVVDTGETFWTGEPIYHGVKLSTATPTITLAPIFSIEPGETYTISLWVKGAKIPNGMSARITFWQLDENRSIHHAYSSGDGEEWTRIEGSYTNTTNERHQRVIPYFYLNRVPGEETYYTSPKLERGPRATPWTPALEDSIQSLLGGSPLSSLPSPLPAHDPTLALRVDNSVGTRVFVGDTMLHGDTGWRRIDTLIVAENFFAGSLIARRLGNTVEIVGYNLRAHADSADLKELITLPQGFRSSYTARYGSSYWSKRWNITPGGRISLGQTAGGDYFNIVYTAEADWPTTLPGTPA